MESLIKDFETAVAPGPERVAAGVVIASATVKGAVPLLCSAHSRMMDGCFPFRHDQISTIPAPPPPNIEPWLTNWLTD